MTIYSLTILHSSASMGMSTRGRGGKHFSKSATIICGIFSGNTIWNWMIKRPFSNGFLYCGMPSPKMLLNESCFTTSPGRLVTTKSLLSNVLITFWKPHNDSTSCNGIVITKSCFDRLNRACSISSNTITMSPGCKSGSWSPSPLNTIFWPSRIPFSMCTSRILRSRTVFLPLHVLQRSLAAIISPCPWQWLHTCSICCAIPGPIMWIFTSIPLPRHVWHFSTAPFLPPRPSHLSQIILFCNANLRTAPLYNSSNVTPNWWTKSLPRRSRRLNVQWKKWVGFFNQ